MKIAVWVGVENLEEASKEIIEKTIDALGEAFPSSEIACWLVEESKVREVAEWFEKNKR